MSTDHWVHVPIYHSVLNVKVLVVLGAFNQEKVLVEAFSMIIKTNGSFAALVLSQVLYHNLDGEVGEEHDHEGEADEEEDPQQVGELAALEVVVTLVEDAGLHVLVAQLAGLLARVLRHPEEHLHHSQSQD